MTLRELSQECSESVDALDFTILAAFALGKSKEFVFREPDYVPSGADEEKLREVLSRRADKEPVAYIVGEKEFFGLPFSVTKDTLVPRPETEFLVEEAIRSLRHEHAKTLVVDLGTGSGNIIVSVTDGHRTDDVVASHLSFFGVDISHGALDVAKRNASRHDMTDRITFLQGDLLEPIPKTAYVGTEYLLVLANLPYLSRGLYDNAMDDVRLYEPESALVADDDGLSYYIRLFNELSKVRNGNLKDMRITGLFEISPEQETRVRTELVGIFPESRHRFIDDLSGRTRVLRFDIG